MKVAVGRIVDESCTGEEGLCLWSGWSGWAYVRGKHDQLE